MAGRGQRCFFKGNNETLLRTVCLTICEDRLFQYGSTLNRVLPHFGSENQEDGHEKRRQLPCIQIYWLLSVRS
jgi:hypothetical protein